MDLPVHDQILWEACKLASRRLNSQWIADPLEYFPVLVRGSWLNDINQVTVFTDYFTSGETNGTPLATVDDGVRTVFHQYWSMQLEQVLARVKGVDEHLAERCAKRIGTLNHVADFGDYKPHDHLDVLHDDPNREYVTDEDHALAKTVSSTRIFIKDRLRFSTTRAPEERLSAERVSTLGRALHSIADFFAHTNFVELMLWELATQRQLDDGLVDYFNRSTSAHPFEPKLEDGFYTPLPRKPDEWPERNGRKLSCGMWYGQAPAATPLASCVFDTQDTVHALLHLYANHLEETKEEASDDQINLAFSILDVAGVPMPLKLLKSIAQISSAVKDVLDAAGRAARKFVAKSLVRTAEGWTDDPSAQALVRSAGALIEHYESSEAAEWARAGKLRYVAHAIALDLAKRVAANTRENRPSLPHHSTLSKDHPPHRIDELVRYNLACYLATELSAEILTWHFGKAEPHISFYDELRDRSLIHPSAMLAANTGRMGELVTSFYRGGWQGRLSPDVTLADWRKG